MASQNFTLNIKALFDASSVRAGVSDIQNAFKNLKLPDNLDKNLKASFANVEKALTDFESRAAKGVKTKADAKGLTGSMDKVIGEFTKLSTVIDKIKGEIGSSTDLSQIIKLNEQDIQKIRDLEKEAAKLKQELSEINTSKVKDLQNILSQIKGEKTKGKVAEAIDLFKQGDIEKSLQLLEELKTKQEQLQKGAANRTGSIDSNIEQIDNLVQTIGKAATETQGKTERLKQITQEQGEIARDAFNKTVSGINQADQAVTGYGNDAQQASGAVNDLANNQARLNGELEQVKSRIQYFLGLTNAINLFKRGIRSAFNTVKDLDKAMTETAVVTEHTVSDMWAKLPEYTKRANQLGVSTLDAYKSATLYYQQGLDDEQTSALSVETLKMARIAGLEAAEATDRMTNAIRGFNMALDADAAQRVDDVYSQLAAHTASNVDEISTAMTKVASLAHNANMEFETTAAFLAQIIETTRESAETAGTALKTVVARFSEVKKLVNEGQLKGADEEGQIIDVNKVGAALRTAGIDLNKYFLGEVGLDDIFIELASKWDNLTAVQQRYIATQAAGSRQQSRFIALMQDYARTQELVGMAYDAEGASAKQFEKTQDSLQSKLARLKNAWNEFLMGITNSAVIKTAVDGLTLLLNIINKITGVLGNGVGGVLKFGTALMAIAGLRNAFKNGGIAEKVIGSAGNSKIGQFFGLGGNGITIGSQITSAGATFQGQVSAAGAAFAAQVNGAAGVNSVAKGGIPEGNNINKPLSLRQRFDEYQKAKTEWAQDFTNKQNEANRLKRVAELWENPLENGLVDENTPSFEIARYQQYYRSASTNADNALNLANKAQPDVNQLGLLGKVGTKLGSGGLGKKLAGTKMASGLASMLGFGSAGGGAAAGGAGATAAAGLAAGLIYVAIAAAAAAAAYSAWYYLTPEGQLKQAKKYAEAMGKTADNAKKQADGLKDAQKAYKEYSDTIDKAETKKARQEAIQKRNETVSNLVEQNERLAKYVSTSQENGQLVLTINEDQLEAAVSDATAGASKAAADESFANALVAGKQADVYAAQLTRAGVKQDLSGIAEYDESGAVVGYRQLTASEYTKYSRIAEARDRSRQEMRNQARQGYQQDLLDNGLSDELANTVAEALSNTFDEDKFLKDIQNQRDQNWWSGKATRKELEAEYYRLYGTQADSSMKRGELAKVVAQGQVNEKRTEQTDKLANYIQSDATGRAADLLKAFNGTFGNRNLFTIDVENEAELYKMFGFDLEENGEELGQALVDLAKALGIETDELRDQLKEQAKLRKKQQEQQLYKTTTAMLGGGISAENIVKFLGLDNVAYQQLFDKIFSSFDSSFISDELVSSLLTGIESEDTALTDWLTTIDLSNPIAAFAELTDKANNATGSIQKVAQELLNAGNQSEQFSAANQMNFLLLSDGYDNISSSVSDLIDKNKQLTSADIKELAKSSSDLNNILKTGAMSAKGLAVALEGIESGKINVTDLNNAILAAINSMDDLDGLVQQTIQDLNSFDPGYDENDVTGFINKVIENAQGNIDKGAWGNNQMRNYMEYIFGSYSGEPGDQYRDWITDNLAWLEANKDNMKSAWTDVANTGVEGAQGVFDEGVRVWEEGGEILIDAAGHTTDELVDILTKGTKLTEEQVRMMIADYKNYSDDFALLLSQNDTQRAVEAWVDGIVERGYYLDSELETLSKLLHKDKDEIKKIVDDIFETNPSKGKKPVEISWDKNKSTSENVSNILGQTGRDNYTTTRNKVYNTHQPYYHDNAEYEYYNGNLINFNQLKSSMHDADLDGYFEQTLNEMTQDSGKFFADFGKGLQEVTIRTGETATEAYQRTKQEFLNQDLADRISDAFSKAFEGKTIEVDTTSGVASLVVLKKAAEEASDAVEATNTTTNATVNANTETAKGKLDDIIKQLATINAGANAKVTVSSSNNSSDVPNIRAMGANIGASGGLVKSYGSGSYRVSPGVALTGEEGAEIVWNKEKGYAYITGEQHPQFQDLQPGDRIFNAQETKKILSMAKGGEIFHSYAGNPSHSYRNAKTGGKGAASGNDKKSSAEWKNELDWLYNLMEDIAELERDQKELEEKFEDILTDQAKTSKDLYKLLIERLANLNVQLERQTFALQKREQEMREFMDTTNDQDKYLWYNWSDRTLEIDWDAIDKIVDGDVYKHVNDLISEAEEIQGKMDDAEDAITDIQNQIQELENIWRDTYVDFEERVLDALVQSYQEVIDNYSELNDTLNDTNSEILNAIQQEIDLERQIRDNTKTEDDIAQKEARLAYLQRDTTGANAAEILKLQQEIEDSRQSYEDTLVDQAVQRLQEDNDAAAKQREEQIEIMQAQLDYSKKAGEFNEQVTSLIQNALSPEGTLLTNSDLYVLLSKQENWSAMSEVNKQVWEEELTSTFKEVGAYLLKTYADWNGQFYQELANSINAVNEKYKISVGSYSQAKAGGSSGSGSGGGGSGGSTTTTPSNNTKTKDEPKDEWIDQGVSPAWDCDSGYHWRNRVYYNPKQKKTKTEVEPKTKGTHTSNEVSRTATTITYKCSICGYTWTGTNRSGTTSTKTTPIGGGCFAPGTRILMGDYRVRNIEDIKINDIIMAYDEENDEFIPKKVMKAYVHHNTPKMVKLTFSNGVILNLTPGHPLYSTDGWKSLDIENSLLEHKTETTLLKINDTIVNINDNAQVTNIEYLNIGLNYDSYNIEVEDCHTFIANGFVAHNSKKIDDRAYYMYATGGLNTKTGPAWLDGTPSEPEYVLNARQTQAFLKLADVLPNIMSNNSASTNNYGGNIYLDLNMHVDEIGSDYDVDRIANRVKDILYDASSYRNVNTINFIR